MWYECLVPFALMTGIMSLPSILMPMYEEWKTNNKYLKDTDDYYIRRNWYRDLYLTGKGYQPTPIDAIPDLSITKKPN